MPERLGLRQATVITPLLEEPVRGAVFLLNDRNICRGTHKAIANYKGQTGRRYETNPVVKDTCGGKKERRHHRTGL